MNTVSHNSRSDLLDSEDKHAAELQGSDLRLLFGPDGPVAQELVSYEMRPSQSAMAEAVKQAILAQGNALIEAPTGTGKSIAYLIPAVLSGKTVVVSTANKSLQHQLYSKDIPFLREVLSLPIPAVVVKGRSNYVCTLKWEREQLEQQKFLAYDREDEQAAYIREWLGTTESGDVDDLPFMLSSDLRPRIVSYPDDCLHSDCRFAGDDCWINQMRDAAANTQVLITNHHLLLNALMLGREGERMLPPATIYIVDEAHQLEQTATSVFETTVTDFTVPQLLRRNVYREHLETESIDEAEMLNTLAFQETAFLNRDNSFRINDDLERLSDLASNVRKLSSDLQRINPYANANNDLSALNREDAQAASEARSEFELAISALNSTADKLRTVATNAHDDSYIRYLVRLFDRRHVTMELHAAPIQPGSMLTSVLFKPEDEDGPVARTVVCTSATLATDGHFEHFKQRCGIDEAVEEHVLPAVFDYPSQALLYQPPLPAYNYRSADTYYAAVAEEIERLLEVSRGRALCLFTSWSGLQHVSDRLKSLEKPVVWPMRAQGDAPRNALLEWFMETDHSVLLATRSFWEGVDIPGEDLSLVVLDKLPFPTPSDPLHSARMEAVEEAGGNSFAEYSVPLMTLSMKQGFGRLIRRASDWGVVAILDERLSSKAYGRRARGDLPPAPLTREFGDVYRFYQQKMNVESAFAVNVWARPVADTSDSERIWWRYRVMRLQDGRADEQVGEAVDMDATEAETHAALQGLADLQQRVQSAGRTVEQFSVELRCSEATAAWLLGSIPTTKLQRDFAAVRAAWGALTVIPVRLTSVWADTERNTLDE